MANAGMPINADVPKSAGLWTAAEGGMISAFFRALKLYEWILEMARRFILNHWL